MATFITTGGGHVSLMGSPEKRVDTTPDGTLWLLTSESGYAKFFSSGDAGSTWTYASGSDLNLNNSSTQTATLPSFYIDRDGYAHVSWILHQRTPQAVCYARGRPKTGGGWSWSTAIATPQIGWLAIDSDVVAFPHGSGWVAWVAYGGGGHAKVARFDVSSTGGITVGAAAHGPPDESSSWVVSLEFDHTGDGKTPTANPHLYLIGGRQGGAHELAGFWGQYVSGNWTWPAYRAHTTLEGTGDGTTGTTNLANTVMASVYDGSDRMSVVWEHGVSLRFVDWNAKANTVTRRDLPALPASVTNRLLGVSIAHDPVTDDLYVVVYGDGDHDIWGTRLVRSTNVWDAWALVATRADDPNDQDGKVQLVRHAPGDTVDLVWGDPASGGKFALYHQLLARLVRTPREPALVSPANGELLDLASGATFSWDHSETGPSDKQQAWAFRRTNGAALEYWNAGSQAFQTTEVWNPGDAQEAHFAPGVWPNGASYPWTVRTRSSSGADSAYAPERTVVATTAPVVKVDGPSGLVFTESTPVVSWTYTSADAQRDYQVRVFVDGPGIDPNITAPVWDSGVVSSSAGRSTRIAVALENGQTYRAYVRATSTTGLTSEWHYTTFSLSLDPPTGPVVRLSTEYAYGSEVPRARLRIQARSNYMTGDQAATVAEWEAEANTGLEFFAGDLSRGIERGLRLTATAAGAVGARNVLGNPPQAPFGQPQPLGPLSFPVQGGDTYTGLAHFRTGQTETTDANGNVTITGPLRAARLLIRWYSSDEGPDGNDPAQAISTVVGEQVIATHTEYRQAYVTATAPDTARRATLVVQALDLAAGEVHHVTRASFHPGKDRTWQPGGFSSTQTVRVERSVDGGSTWEPVLAGLGVDTYQKAVARDRLMPLGTEVGYRAFTEVQAPSGARLTSGSSPVGHLSVESDLWTLRDPTDEDGEVFGYVVGHDRGDRDAASVSHALGREFAVVDSEGPQGASGTLTLYVPGDLVLPTVDLLKRGRPLIVQSPIGERFTAHFLSRDYDPEVARGRTISAEYVEVG